MKKPIVLIIFISFILTLPIFSQWEYIRNDNPALFDDDTLIGNMVVEKETIFINRYFSKNNGENWNYWKLNSTREFNYINRILVKDNEVFVATDSLYYSSDFGSSWENRSNELNDYLKSYTNKSVGLIRMKNNGNLFLGTSESGVFMSSTNGANWIDINNQSTRNCRLRSIAVMNNYLLLTGFSKIFRTSDYGVTWDSIPKAMVNIFLPLEIYLYAGATSGLYISKDFGDTWELISNQQNIRGIIKIKNTIIIGSYDYGVFYSTDDGATWNEYNEGLNCKKIGSIGYNSKYVFIASETKGCGLYRASLSNFGISDVEDIYPNEVTISPNPTSDYIEIDMNSEISSQIYYTIYDYMGEVVFLENTLELNKIKIDVTKLSVGVYFLNIKSGAESRTCKFIINR